MKVSFWGHSCLYVEHGGHRIIIDPFLTGNPVAKVKASDVECDYIILTHGHGDHVGDTIQIAKANDATVISNFEIATYCSNKGCKAHAMHIGGAHDFDFGRVKLTIAHHGSGLVVDQQIVYLGNPAGVLLTMGGKTLYHAGDTCLFYDMKLIGELHRIDAAFLPIGDNFTMGINDAVKAVEFLRPGVAVPIHYSTFELIDADPKLFVNKVKDLGQNARVLEVGASMEV